MFKNRLLQRKQACVCAKPIPWGQPAASRSRSRLHLLAPYARMAAMLGPGSLRISGDSVPVVRGIPPVQGSYRILLGQIENHLYCSCFTVCMCNVILGFLAFRDPVTEHGPESSVSCLVAGQRQLVSTLRFPFFKFWRRAEPSKMISKNDQRVPRRGRGSFGVALWKHLVRERVAACNVPHDFEPRETKCESCPMFGRPHLPTAFLELQEFRLILI